MFLSSQQWLGGLTPEHLLPIIEDHCIKVSVHKK